MIAELRNSARQIVQSPAQITRHRVSSMTGEVNLYPPAAALDFNPYTIVLAGDNGRCVHEKREILHAVTPSLVELRLYQRGASKRVRAVNEAHLKLTGGGLAKLGGTKLLEESDSRMWREADFLEFTSSNIEADAHHVIIICDNRRGRDKFTGHTNELLWPLAFLFPAQSGNARAKASCAQLNVCIALFLRTLPLKFAGFEHHIVSHFPQLCGVHPQASGPLNTLVSFCVFFARWHRNHSHQSASYSHAHHRAGSVGCNTNPTENMA